MLGNGYWGLGTVSRVKDIGCWVVGVGKLPRLYHAHPLGRDFLVVCLGVVSRGMSGRACQLLRTLIILLYFSMILSLRYYLPFQAARLRLTDRPSGYSTASHQSPDLALPICPLPENSADHYLCFGLLLAYFRVHRKRTHILNLRLNMFA